MTKTTPERRAWLDSLKVGELVCISCDGHPNHLASITDRTAMFIVVERAMFSKRTGRISGPHGRLANIEPVTCEIRAKLEHQRSWRVVDSALHRNIPTSVLHLFELILDWQHSPDVILAATERIHEVTRERMEAQR